MTGKEYNKFITDIVKNAVKLLKKNKGIDIKIVNIEYIDEIVCGEVVANSAVSFEYPKKSSDPWEIVFDIDEWATADLAIQDGLRFDSSAEIVFKLMPEEKLEELKNKLPEHIFITLCAALKIYAFGAYWKLL